MERKGFYVTFFNTRDDDGADIVHLKSTIPQHLVNDRFQYECAITRIAFVTATKRCMYMIECPQVNANMVMEGVCTQIVAIVDTKQKNYAKSYNLPHYFRINSNPLTELNFDIISPDPDCVKTHVKEICMTVHVRKVF